MRYRYYIFDPFEGTPTGTDSEKVAEEFALCEDYFVVDTESGKWLLSDLSEQDIEAAISGVPE